MTAPRRGSSARKASSGACPGVAAAGDAAAKEEKDALQKMKHSVPCVGVCVVGLLDVGFDVREILFPDVCGVGGVRWVE